MKRAPLYPTTMPSTQILAPARVAHADDARRRYPAEFAKLIPALERVDPLADALVAWADEAGQPATRVLDEALALRLGGSGQRHPSEPANALLDQLLHRPAWVDMDRVNAGGAALRRAALTGGLVLAFRSLVSGYAAPAGNKPLAFSGRLEASAARRLDETGRFVRAVSEPAGLNPDGEGFLLTARVRLMHAGVRRLLLRSGRWDQQAWSSPINQHDMLATILLFSSVWLSGCRLLGQTFGADEAANHMHLWRYVGYLMGVEESLLPTSEEQGVRLQEFTRLTQHAPDEDSRRLVRALMTPPPTADPTWQRRLLQPLWTDYLNGLCHVLLDPELCSGLGIPAARSVRLIRRSSRLRSAVGQAVLSNPALDRQLMQWGERYWQQSVGRIAGTLQYDYPTPTALGKG